MQLALEERVNTLESVLGHFIVSTDIALNRMERGIKELKEEMKAFKDEMKDFKREMKDFKDEMKDFKDEMKDFKLEMKDFKVQSERDRKEMNRKWGDLANKMGTLVEDMVAPNISGIANKYFHSSELDFFGICVKKRNTIDRSIQREFDLIAVSDKYFIINETKSKPRISYIDEFIDMLNTIFQFFPEYSDKQVIPIFASIYIPESIVKYLTSRKIYAMGMKDDTMDLLNFEDFSNLIPRQPEGPSGRNEGNPPHGAR